MICIWKIINSLRSPFPTADPTNIIMLCLMALGMLVGFVRWCYKKLLGKYPFTIKETYEDYETYKIDDKRTFTSFLEPIRIFCLNNKWGKDKITLYFKARRRIKLTRINLRFIDNIPENKLAIDNVIFPQQHYTFKIEFKPDRKGGFDGYIIPPTDIPQKTILFFEIFPQINVTDKLKCKISLENSSSGEERRTFTRKTVIVTNEVI
jgi:hypothetical protein